MESDHCALGMHDTCGGYIDLSADFTGYCTCTCHGGARQPVVVRPPDLPPGHFTLTQPPADSDPPLALTL